ncbi:TetR/AcrR family transcriptional regulator [Aquisediminimonas profunda]|uniref:TetR/AcrR family transcriptional regulator n=1 Tax=Aquisediminimonas profunda TaxID=1550733 RepID=UPI001C631292|nr:TetR/AcrR family transcriptional regulator [Aquisediminimonas profunda]
MSVKKPYHKENLRRDLLDAGRKYVRDNGHQGLSIRMLAQQVGVSPGAPYHHFPDRRSFLLALAVDQFDALLQEASQDTEDGLSSTDVVKLRAMKFVRFALDNPHMLELMYESDLTRPDVAPQLQQYQEKSHQSGADSILRCLPDISEKEAGMRNIGLWTSIYGLVSMINKGIIRPFGDGEYSIDEICDWVVDRAVRSALAP